MFFTWALMYGLVNKVNGLNLNWLFGSIIGDLFCVIIIGSAITMIGANRKI